jgi:cytochrome c oxidase assembly factor CtaG
MNIDPTTVFAILNVVVPVAILAGSAWLAFSILRGHSRWPKLLLPILALVIIFSGLALVTFPLGFGASSENQQRVEVDQ